MWNGIKRLWHSLAHLLRMNRVAMVSKWSTDGKRIVTRARCIGCGQYVDDGED